VSGTGWTLDLDSERDYLLPWLDTNPHPDVRGRVLQWIAGLLRDPDRPHLEDHGSGVFSVTVPGTNVAVVWLLDVERRVVVLVGVGPI
jgi:hypothetical protein